MNEIILTYEEVQELEKQFKYSFIMYESDILRFKFDISQFKVNVAYEIKFIDLMPLYNEWYYKYSKVFLNLMKKTFVVIKAQGYEDTFLLFLTDSDRGAKRLQDLSKMKSFKFKANFTKAERKLLNKISGFSSSRIQNHLRTEHIKNGLYFETLQDNIKETEDYIKAKEEMKEIYNKFYDNLKGTKDPRKNKIKMCIIYLNQDIYEAEIKLEELKTQEDNLIYSLSEKETTTEDYI